jgi:hypothetical protein
VITVLKRQARIWNFLDVVDNGLFRLLTKTKSLLPQKERYEMVGQERGDGLRVRVTVAQLSPVIIN